MTKGRDPATLTEWQLAVNAARACLVLESARQYGLVTDGPSVDVTRCLDLLDRGKTQLIVPQEMGVDLEIKALIHGSFRSHIR